MDYGKLKQLIIENNIQELSDIEIANILNDKSIPTIVSRFVTARTILNEIPTGAIILEKLEHVSSMDIPDGSPLVLFLLRAAVKWSMSFLKTDASKTSGVDIGCTSTHSVLNGLMQIGVLTQDEVSSIINLALSNMSKAESAGLGRLDPEDVAIALRGGY